MTSRDEADIGEATRAGYVALVGAPNVGKSSLMNALIGEKLSIVTARAQTTREPITGILSTQHAQLIFVDTPGLLEPRYALQESMLHSAIHALEDADVVLLLLDGMRPDQVPGSALVERLRAGNAPVIPVINKTDAADSGALSTLTSWAAGELGGEVLLVSALTSDGCDRLLEVLTHAVPQAPFYYPSDELATQSVRFFAAEFVRETLYELYEQEIPYGVVVRVEEFDEAAEPWRIRATVYVERESQKGIVVGKGGAAIKRLGTRSRAKIEAFLGRQIYLELWVKTLHNWRKRRSTLRLLGFSLPAAASDAGNRSATGD